ncbi:hypothetical protein BRADI_4g36957v3 [Brachypodium distachyon]|uniref:Uncharacterized protein n=1 Tax=Brachypodium distachyon TaxID=15368 RepID=A0A2K2CSQ8_BRADI|nr:hypothetical protein BRADI_4g36957v3 [Brachypodium distachyon]
MRASGLSTRRWRRRGKMPVSMSAVGAARTATAAKKGQDRGLLDRVLDWQRRRMCGVVRQWRCCLSRANQRLFVTGDAARPGLSR